MKASQEGLTLNGNKWKREYNFFEFFLIYSSHWGFDGHGLFAALYQVECPRIFDQESLSILNVVFVFQNIYVILFHIYFKFLQFELLWIFSWLGVEGFGECFEGPFTNLEVMIQTLQTCPSNLAKNFENILKGFGHGIHLGNFWPLNPLHAKYFVKFLVFLPLTRSHTCTMVKTSKSI